MSAQTEQIWLGKRLTVLVDEDNSMNQKFIVGLLNKLRLVVEVVDNGREALERWQQGGIDLILMDVQMPEMGGIEALRLLRQQQQAMTQHAPVIALTAHALRGDAERLLDQGFDGYLSKPLHLKSLVAELKRVVSEPFN